MKKTVTKLFNGGLAAKHYFDLIILLLKTNDPMGLSDPALVLYTCTKPLFSNIFSETTWPIIAKFHMEPFSEGRTKVYINSSGHMTKIAATPIYGKDC